MRVIALIGDLVASRAIIRRNSLQTRLGAAMDAINRDSRPASAFTFSAGDELEAVYRDGDTLFRDLLAITSAIHPYRIRFSIALGAITTKLHPTNPLVIDGPAFHLARAGIEDLKATKETIRITAARGIDVKFESDAARLLALHIGQWKQSRWSVYRELAQGTPRIDIGAKLGISVAAVYKNIHAGAIDLVANLADDLGSSLSKKIGK